MKTVDRQTLIDQVTRNAYENVVSWQGSDSAIAAHLRDGLRTLLEAFDRIEVDGDENTEGVLRQMLAVAQDVLGYYRSLPGSQGEWECAAVGKVEAEILKRLDEG